MSNIDAQIRALQLKKKKIDYVSYLADLIKNDTRCVDFEDVQKEIVSRIEPFFLELMTAIENDAEPDVSATMDSERRKALVELADKVLAAKKNPKIQYDAPKNNVFAKAPKESSKPIVSNQDKMSFALDNRHLGGKRVQVENDTNSDVVGTVVGLDAPFVVVKTDSGPTIQVPIEKVMMI